MSRIIHNRITGELFRRPTLGDLVRAEALRRPEWASNADACARRAEAWYGRCPCRGKDLRIVFDAVFSTE